MERVTAFTDEYGSFGGDTSNESVSTHVIITAIIVDDEKIAELRQSVESIRSKYFQTGEMKSSTLGKNHAKRTRLLQELSRLPFSVFAVVFDKDKLNDHEGMHYKTSFYKFINKIVHEALVKTFPHLTVISDEIGRNEYMASFIKYIKEYEKPMNLLGESDFAFQNSKADVLVQLADVVSGSLAYDFDRHKKKQGTRSYQKILAEKICYIDFFPRAYESFIHDAPDLSDDDRIIATLCVKRAADYVEARKDDSDEEIKAQLIVLRYLLLMFTLNGHNDYISTKELKRLLSSTPLADMSTQSFRTRIIGKMRDNGVIISGSSVHKGYKIPANQAELFDFINHGTMIIMPMLERLKKCRDIVKMGTMNRVDLFDKTEYSSLKKFFE